MMYSALFSVAALVATVVAQDVTIDTPSSLTTCQPVQLTFSGGSPPYIITAIPAASPSSEPLTTISSDATTSPLSWKVNLPAGTNVTLQIVDSTGAKNFDSPRVIFAGTDASCVGAAPGSSGAPSSSTGSVASSATSAASTSLAASASSASSVGSSAASSASSAASSASSAASSTASSASHSSASSASGASASASKASSAISSASASATSKPSAAGLSKSANWVVAAMGIVGAAVLA